MPDTTLSKEQIELLLEKFLDDEVRNTEYFQGVCVAVDLVEFAIHDTDFRIENGYLPKITNEARHHAIVMEYLYRSTDIDNQGYNEPICCTPFYTDELRKRFPKAFEGWEAPEE